MRNYYRRIGTIISQSLNVVLLNGEPDESISARSYRQGVLQGHSGWCRVRRFVDALYSPFEADHCHKAYLTDYNRALTLVMHCRVTHGESNA